MDASVERAERIGVRAEKARTWEILPQSEAKYKALFETAGGGLWWTDQDGYVIEISPSMAEMLGYRSEEVVGRVWTEFVSDQGLSKGSEKGREHQGRRANSYKIGLRKKDGTILWEDISVYPLRCTYGRHTTPSRGYEQEKERKVTSGSSAEEVLARVAELQRAAERRNRILRMVAHELRDPLSIILGRMEILERTHLARDEEVLSAIETVKRQTEHLARVVEDLLCGIGFTEKKVAQQMILKKTTMVLNTIVNDAIEDMRPDFEAKGIRLLTRIGAEPIALHGDPIRIAECLRNLLRNAWAYTKEDGTVHVSVQTKRDSAVIRVRDNGIGIRPEVLDNIFEPYVQDSASDHPAESLGLGLAIVRTIVEMHDGDVSAYSPGLGQGSQFTLRLPLPG